MALVARRGCVEVHVVKSHEGHGRALHPTSKPTDWKHDPLGFTSTFGACMWRRTVSYCPWNTLSRGVGRPWPSLLWRRNSLVDAAAFLGNRRSIQLSIDDSTCRLQSRTAWTTAPSEAGDGGWRWDDPAVRSEGRRGKCVMETEE